MNRGIPNAGTDLSKLWSDFAGHSAKLMEIAFPIEFIVPGNPISLQATGRKSLSEWKARVKEASSAVIPSPHYASEGRIAVTVYYLPAGPAQVDIDNIVKPILDALSRHIYIDDRQVERVVVQKFEPSVPIPKFALSFQRAP